MSKRLVTLPRSPGSWDLDLVSHGRGGPSGGVTLSPEQVQQVMRTVRRTPEVVVKVSGGGRDTGGVKAHFDYIDRHGKQPIVTDEGRELLGKTAGADLVSDWNLDLSRGQYGPKPQHGETDRRPKIVHNIVLSMPGRTPPDLVLQAAQKFARENFALQHRYAMVLHTDQAHPHVHLVVKAEHEYEPGKRLHIKKATLRQWREQFAACLRELGVPANATSGVVRGRVGGTKKDAIHHRLQAMRTYDALPAEERALRQPPRESSFMRKKVEAVAKELQAGHLGGEVVKSRLLNTRQAVEGNWAALAELLSMQGEVDLAREVTAFTKSLPRVRTDNERIAQGLLAEIEAQRSRRTSDDPPLDREKAE